MNDMVPEEKYTPTSVLAGQGVAAIGYLIGGGGLLLLSVLPPVMALAAGALVGIVGIGALLSRDPDDRKPALIATAAGALVVLSRIPMIPLVKVAAASGLSFGALGLIAMGIWKGIKFIKGLKSRG